MTSILRHLPFMEKEDEVNNGLERVSVKPYQIIAWVSVTARSVVDLPPHAPRLPAIIDTGHSHNFSIQERHVVDWARVPIEVLPPRKTITVGNRKIPLHLAAVWIHPNQPGFRDRFSAQQPFRLDIPQGIAVYPSDGNFPRLPLLGLRALVRNRPHLTMDPERHLLNLRTPDWRTFLIGWLS